MCAFSGRNRSRERVSGRVGGFLSLRLSDKRPSSKKKQKKPASRHWGCHLLANMLSVIFCALGSPSGAGPHGSPAHANRTNPSWTCLSVSLSSISLSVCFSPLPSSLPSTFCSTVHQAVLSPCSLIYFTLCPLISPPLSLSLSPSLWG